jgi:hypothetical protein
METVSLGSLVQHLLRPGVWRLIGDDRAAGSRPRLVIEPWDDAAAGSLHPSEAYELRTAARLLRPLRPGRSKNETAAGSLRAR